MKKENEKKTESTEKVKTEKEKIQQKPDETAELKKQLEEYKDKWVRSVAEFDNYKKRNSKIYSEAFADGQKDAIIKILPVGDNLEWALTLGLDEKTSEGIKKLIDKYSETLKSLGAEEINPLGQPFDPNLAEAIMQVDGDEQESGTVKQVFQKGYKLNGKIIRYATCSVVK